MHASIRLSRQRWPLAFLFWAAITVLFLYERTYLIQKAGLPHFLACAAVRVGALLVLCLVHLRLLWPGLVHRKAYGAYAGGLALIMTLYLLGQGLYDQYLFGYVIGDQEHHGLLANLPYNVLTTSWYLLLTTLLAHPVWQPTPAPTPRANEPGVPSLLVKSGTQWLRLPIASIVYAEGLKDYTLLYTEAGKRHIVKGSVGKLMEQLPTHQFARIHKSYWVSWAHIQAMSATTVSVPNQTLPLGRTYAATVLQRWQQVTT